MTKDTKGSSDQEPEKDKRDKSENNQIQNRSRREEEGWESLIPHIGLIPMLIPLGSTTLKHHKSQ